VEVMTGGKHRGGYPQQANSPRAFPILGNARLMCSSAKRPNVHLRRALPREVSSGRSGIAYLYDRPTMNWPAQHICHAVVQNR
jgi:hypothetical protein